MPDVKALLTKKIGPLPAWGWGIGLAGVAVVAKHLQNAKAATDPNVDQGAATGQTGAYYPHGGGGGATYQINARNSFSCPPGMFRGLDGRCHKKCPKGSFRGLDGQCHKKCPKGQHRALNGKCVPNGPVHKPPHVPPYHRHHSSHLPPGKTPPIFDRRLIRKRRVSQGPG